MTYSIEPLERRRLLATYYVTPTGDDNATGLAPEQAWRTPDRANAHRFRPGDVLLFRAGGTYDGHLYLSARDAGTESKPVVVSTFGGKSRATIRSGDRNGFELSEGAGVAVTNLKFVGSGMTSNDAYGIYVHAGIAGKVLSYLHVRNVEVTGYGREGLTIVASGAGSSINNVKVDRSSFHHNRWGGITVTGSSRGGNRNYVIDHVRAHDHPGVATGEGGFVTGNGIYLADVEDAVVQRCVVFNNGAEGTAPVGIWTAGSNRVTIQHNESHHNRTASSTDGGGFDLDWNVTNSVLQYNYSHDNDGPGYMLGAGATLNEGNVVRYNVSENDGRKNGKGSIYLWGNVTNAAIYNNTIYLTATADASNAALRASDAGAGGKVPKGVSVRNNIFFTTGGAKLINVSSGMASAASFSFNGNAWYAGGATAKWQWGGTTYESLATWRAVTGQETTKGQPVGFFGDPKLIAPGTGGTLDDADRLGELLGYRLHKRSPLINAGRPYPANAAPLATFDFFGEPIPVGTRPDIGADEIR